MELAVPFPIRSPVTWGSFSSSGVGVGDGFWVGVVEGDAEGDADGDSEGEGAGVSSAGAVGAGEDSAADTAAGAAIHSTAPSSMIISVFILCISITSIIFFLTGIYFKGFFCHNIGRLRNICYDTC